MDFIEQRKNGPRLNRTSDTSRFEYGVARPLQKPVRRFQTDQAFVAHPNARPRADTMQRQQPDRQFGELPAERLGSRPRASTMQPIPSPRKKTGRTPPMSPISVNNSFDLDEIPQKFNSAGSYGQAIADGSPSSSASVDAPPPRPPKKNLFVENPLSSGTRSYRGSTPSNHGRRPRQPKAPPRAGTSQSGLNFQEGATQPNINI